MARSVRGISLRRTTTYQMFLNLLLLSFPFAAGNAETSLEAKIPPKIPPHEIKLALGPPMPEPEVRLTMLNSSSIANEKETVPSIRVSDIIRLPKALKPLEYTVKILPYLNEPRTFHGEVTIKLEVLEITSDIQFHMANISLNDSSLTVKRRGNEIIGIRDQYYLPDSEVAFIILDRDLFVGDFVTLSTSYSGFINNNSIGLNEIEFTDEDGKQSRVLATYLQPTGARHLFPCLDEPGLKATFLLKVAKRKGQIVLSNTEPNITSKSTTDDSLVWVEFERTLPMSPYLVAFVICDFGKLVRNTHSGKRVSVWARKGGVLRRGTYAAYIAPRAVEWFEEFTGIPLPLKKLDLITFPSYTVPGMENFGLISTEESSLITSTKLKRKEWVATVVAHEIAHQWAGDLVTPIWWSQFWLSEGFATYMAALALDQLEPTLEAINHLVARETMWFRRTDVGSRSSSLVVDSYDPLNANLKNSNIYYKGAALLRMLNSILGEKTFVKGIKNYFSKYQYRSASQLDFFETLTKSLEETGDILALPETLDVIMTSWLYEKSYPVVYVRRNGEGTFCVSNYVVGQEDDEVDLAETNSTVSQSVPPPWWVPISYVTSRTLNFSDTSPKKWFLYRETHPVTLDGTGILDEWVIVNVQQSVYMRVNYDDATWKKISNFLTKSHQSVHVLNRAQLVDDAFYFFDRGHLNASVPFDVISYFPQERSLFPFRAAFIYLQNIEIILRGTPSHDLLKKYVLSLLSPILAQPFGSTHMQVKLHQQLLSWACRFLETKCVEMALRRYKLWIVQNDMEVFPEYAVESYLCAAIEAGTHEDWNIAFQRYLNLSSTTSQETKELLMKGLACTKDEATVLGFLDALSEPGNGVSSEDARNIFNELTRSSRWNNLMWTYLRKNWEAISIRFQSLPVPFVSTPADLEQLKLLFEERFSHISEIQKNLEIYLQDSVKHAKRSERIIFEVSEFLNKKYALEKIRKT